MGLFSSIGDFFSDAVDTVTDVGKGLLGIGDVASGVMNNKVAGDNLAFQKDAFNKSYNESVRQYNQNYKLAQSQDQLQRDFLKNRIRWSIEDAQKAGLHPMAALGLSSGSFSPVSASPGSLPSVPDLTGPSYDWVADAGQSLAYASAKAKDRKQQEEAFQFQRDVNREQLHGLELDNELKVMQLLSEVQRLNTSGPASASVNGGSNLIVGQDDSPSYSIIRPYGKDLFTLFTLARHGDTLYEIPHPDIADSITETEWKNILASIDAEAQVQGGSIKPPVYKLNPDEREAVRKHRYELVRIPGVGWKLDRNPSRAHPLDKLSNYEKFKRKNTQRWNGKTEVKGKIF